MTVDRTGRRSNCGELQKAPRELTMVSPGRHRDDHTILDGRGAPELHDETTDAGVPRRKPEIAHEVFPNGHRVAALGRNDPLAVELQALARGWVPAARARVESRWTPPAWWPSLGPLGRTPAARPHCPAGRLQIGAGRLPTGARGRCSLHGGVPPASICWVPQSPRQSSGALPRSPATPGIPPYRCATASLTTKRRRARSFKDAHTRAWRCAICSDADACRIDTVGSSHDLNAMVILLVAVGGQEET